MKRLDRYLFRQLAVALVAVTVGLAALVWLTQSLRFIELVLDRGLSPAVFVELTGLLLPSFVAVILPITTFVVTLFTYVRLSGDRELVVMRAAGLSDWRLARPALMVAGLATGLCLFLQLWLVPVSHAAFRAWQFEIRNQMAAILVQEGVFSAVGDDLTVYARRRDRDGNLYGIMVHDTRDPAMPVTIMAEEGRLVGTPRGPRVTLQNGVRQTLERAPDGTPRLSVLTFKENSLDLATSSRSQQDATRNRDSRERFVGELLSPDPAENLPERDIRKFRAEAHQRLASPFTALAYALVALATALSTSFRRHGDSRPAVVGVTLVVGLLALGLAAGNAAARNNAFIPLIWVQVVLPMLASIWVLLGSPGLPRRQPRLPPELEAAPQGAASGPHTS
ncbi:LPS export ABC transporter permease LptF [Roseomonas marmotae]|uniref:LPS export ABC transporter permease LptF n=1 Tax=Roseomonas marmotae TaxID=2768161 RepID=A0ABS3KHL9_9PROT|nr:LPS export ABC transporter permease LptF [Roseomonas marmotae]MBO1076957.1 LPS export ABC transporter permease LptF [Roseomonas marmotae]QTI80047.1 LPS export ABC transporter permease LptF [Roseomonas marmotae]